jgi:hypothetical protein
MPNAPTRLADRARATRQLPGRPFTGLVDAVIVDGETVFDFPGAIASRHADAVWLWLVRDLGHDVVDIEMLGDDERSAAALGSLLHELTGRARQALTDAGVDAEANRRLRAQLGGDEVVARLPLILNALRVAALLEKAQAFGRATNAMADEAALAMALQSMPMQDQAVAALLMHAAVGQIANPARLVAAAIQTAGGATEAALTRAGFAPLVEALLSHAQDQVHQLDQVGVFADVDRICRAVDRFHRLLRGLTTYVELNRGGRWAAVAAALTKTISDRLDPRVRDAGPDLNKALRRREGTDRIDRDQILLALNAMYLLATVRDCRPGGLLSGVSQRSCPGSAAGP